MNDFRRTPMYAATAVALAVAAGGSLATDTRNERAARAPGDATPITATSRAGGDMRVSDIIGKEVVGSRGRSLGEVKDLLIDMKARRIAYALVSGGEVFDPVEDRLVQIPVGDVSPTVRDGRFHVQLGRQDLAGYPTIDLREWQDRYRDSAARGTPQPLRRASEVLEAGLLDASGRRVGEVEDVIVNTADGSLRYGVAEFDPSWVQQGKLVALPIDAVQAHPGGGNDLVLRIQRSDLARAPTFDRARWPELGDRGLVQRVTDFFAAR